jgi:serine/threonine protein phosphatase PrpC
MCDGHSGAEVAEAVVAQVRRLFTSNQYKETQWGMESDVQQDSLASLMKQISDLESQLDPIRSQLQGTTCTIAIVPKSGDQVHVLWVGDSPAYLVSESKDGRAQAIPLINPHNQHHVEDVSHLEGEHGTRVSAEGYFMSQDGRDVIAVSRMVSGAKCYRPFSNQDISNGVHINTPTHCLSTLVDCSTFKHLEPSK